MMEKEQTRTDKVMSALAVLDTHSHFLINGHYLGKHFSKRHKPPVWWNPMRNHIDLPRLQAGGVTGSVFTVYVPPPPLRWSAWAACLRILDTLENISRVYAAQVALVERAQEIVTANQQGKIALMAGVEGGHVIGRKVERLTILRKRRVRILTLTHLMANRICDSSTGPKIHGGLSAFGREVIRVCQENEIVVDLTHTSQAAFFQALEQLDRPPMVTHSALVDKAGKQRLLNAEQARAVAERSGGIGVILFPWYLKPWSLFGGLELVVDTYARLADLVGAEHLMLGTDMDGYIWLPRGFKDAASLPLLIDKLSAKGFSEAELSGILAGNALRILEAWER